MMGASGENMGRRLPKEILALEPTTVARFLQDAQLGNRHDT